MSKTAIVIGADANGLVTAHLLAKRGMRVTVLDQKVSANGRLDEGWIPPRVLGDLGLANLTIERADPWIRVALTGGGTLDLRQDVVASVEAIRKLSPHDASRWPEFCARMRTLAGVLEELYTQPAPDVETTEPAELLRLGLLGLKVRRLGRQAIIDLLRIMPMSVAELLDDWFECDALKAALGTAAVRHLAQGPRSGGTAFSMLHHHVGCAAGVFRHPRSNLSQLLERTIAVRRGEVVRQITVQAGRATGVVLASGEEITAETIASSADPRSTLLGLTDAGWYDPEFVRAVSNIRARQVAARVTLHLDGPAGFDSLLVAPTLDYIERAYDDSKYGRPSANPWIEAHASGNTVEAHVQYVPRDGGSLGAAVASVLPLASAVSSTDVATFGHAYQGEMTLDQILFMRPVAGWSRYRTPIQGLYLCGAGSHPGGAVTGGAGWLAAREILKDAR